MAVIESIIVKEKVVFLHLLQSKAALCITENN